jgi:hypothetical protein
MNRKTLLILSFSLLAVQFLFAQNDTIMLMKGKRIIANKAKILIKPKGDTVITYYDLEGEMWQVKINKVFALTTSGKETVFYKPETDDPEELSVEQMRWFLRGKADFRDWRFSPGIFAGGFLSGAAGALIPPVGTDGFSNSASIRIGFAIPIGYLIFAGNSTLSIEQLKVQYPELTDNQFYLMGVQEAIRQHRMRDSFFGVAIGTIIGIMGTTSYD